MGNKGKNMIFALAGVYLAYLGGSLILQSYREKPDQYVLFIVAGIGFLVFGLVILGGYLKAFFKHEEIKEIGEEDSEEEMTDADGIPAESSDTEEAAKEEPKEEAKEAEKINELDELEALEEIVAKAEAEAQENGGEKQNPDNIVTFPGYIMEEVPLKDSGIEELTVEETSGETLPEMSEIEAEPSVKEPSSKEPDEKKED